MSDIQVIVERLNAPPFNKNFTLVAFDEKTAVPTEALQLLNDVLSELDKVHKVDARDESPEAASARISSILSLLKYPLPNPSEMPAFMSKVVRGDRTAIYPILAFVLSKLPQLKKRAYVAKYLMAVEVPPEFMHDAGVMDALATYQQFQSEFKEVHKQLDKTAGSSGGPKTSPAELRKEIQQLEDERTQLVEKIANLKKKTAEVPGFAVLLESTSNLRKEQEEEGKLAERMHEQRINLQAAQRRYADVNRRLAETRASTNEEMSAEAVLEAARREAAEGRQLCKKTLPASIEARKETLVKLTKMLSEPAKTEEDLYALRGQVAATEDLVTRMTQEVAAQQRAAGDDKLAMFRQQSAILAKKLAQKEESLELLMREGESLAREIEAKESKLSEMSGPRFMRREEFNAYANALRSKTQTFKQLKQELSDIRQETVVLGNTEKVVKSRAGDLDDFLQRMEEKKGVTGYTVVQSEMEKISALKQRIDESKGKTLQEISRIVDDINAMVRDRKNNLQPAIKELRQVRGDYGELEAVYLRDKAVYDNTAAGLEAERSNIEKMADVLQDEAIREESRYHQLQLLIDTTQIALDRAKEEAGCEKPDGRFLRDFKTRKDLYQQKLTQLETMAKELRKKQKDIKENSGLHAAQRSRFLDLRRLLLAKQAIYRADPSGGYAGLANGGVDALLGLGATRPPVGFEETGGAHVMTLE